MAPSPATDMPMPTPSRGGLAFVAGAGGFIGRHTVAALRNAGWFVVGLGTKREPDDNLGLKRPNCWFEGRLMLETLLSARARLGSPELVVNAAGGSSVPLSFSDPAGDFYRTVEGTHAILQFLRAGSSEAKLILLSSAAVYGSAAPGGIAETARLAPISPYGAHKRVAEDLAGDWSRLFGLDVAIVRFFSVYGPGLRKQLLWELTERLLAEPARIELGGDGRELRDFLAIDDAVRLIGRIVACPPTEAPLVVNGGVGRGVEIRELAGKLRDAVGCRTEIAFSGVVRTGDPRSLVADVGRSRALGFEPTVPLETGIARFVEWVRLLGS